MLISWLEHVLVKLAEASSIAFVGLTARSHTLVVSLSAADDLILLRVISVSTLNLVLSILIRIRLPSRFFHLGDAWLETALKQLGCHLVLFIFQHGVHLSETFLFGLLVQDLRTDISQRIRCTTHIALVVQMIVVRLVHALLLLIVPRM